VIVLSSFTIECFPFSVLEAMSASKPAVCTAIGGLPELVEDGVTGHLVAPRDPEGLAEGILRVIGPPGRAQEMGAAARRRLEERFTLQRCVDETARTLGSIVGAARG
jgi:glycosyltransferase involved in cell wall biosynthesis